MEQPARYACRFAGCRPCLPKVTNGLTGAIDANPRLECDLTGPGYELDNKVRILLESKDEMKARGLDSPDDADALALTFARRVAPPRQKPESNLIYGYPGQDGLRWMM
jgi:hypothetical protein